MQDALAYLPLGSNPCSSVTVATHYSLVRCRKFSPAGAAVYRLYGNGRQLFTCTDRHELLERFRSIASLHVAEVSRIRTFVHAGVVGWGGVAILIPGRSFSGKTTLVAELVRAGATYYSDEFALIDKRGMVHPYSCPLQVRENGSCLQTQKPVEAFGGLAGREPLPVRLVVVSRYRARAHWRPHQLTAGIGLLKILDNTVSARKSPARALRTLKQIVSNAVIMSGVRGEASQIVDWVGERFGSAQPSAT